MRQVSFLILIVLLISPFWSCEQSTCNIKDYQQRLDSITEMYESKIIAIEDELSDVAEIILNNTGYLLSEKHRGMANASTNTIVNFDAFDRDNTVFIHVSPLSCWSCIHLLKNQMDCVRIDSVDFIYLVSAFDDEINKAFIDFTSLPLDKTYILKDSLQLPIEKSNLPFSFKIDGNLKFYSVLPYIKNSSFINESFINFQISQL